MLERGVVQLLIYVQPLDQDALLIGGGMQLVTKCAAHETVL